MADVEMVEVVIKMPKEKYDSICNMYGTFPAEMKEWGLEAIRNGTPLQEVHKNKLKDLSERVENIEKQMKEDKEEQLKKLKAEIDYAKFRCNL